LWLKNDFTLNDCNMSAHRCTFCAMKEGRTPISLMVDLEELKKTCAARKIEFDPLKIFVDSPVC